MSDTEARDRLAQIIDRGMCPETPDDVRSTEDAIADAVLAAGWRPPARVATTVEELDALPELAVIRDSEGTVAELAFGMWFSSDGRVFGLRLPATVLWEPEEGE